MAGRFPGKSPARHAAPGHAREWVERAVADPAAARPPRRALVGGGALAVLLAAAHVANDAITSMLATLLPTLQARFGLSAGMLALLVAVFSFSSSVTQPLFGALSDRLGRRPLAAFGLVLSVSLLSLMAVAPSVWTLLGLLVVGGLGSAAFHPAGTSIARAAAGEAGGRREFAVGLFSAGGMLGLALGPVLVLAVTTTLGLGYTPWLMVPGLVLGVLVNLVAPASSRPQQPRASSARVLDVPSLRRLLAGPVGLLCVAGILMEVAFVTFTSGMPLWLVARRGVARDAALLGWTLTTFYLAAALGGLAAGALSRRVDRRRLVAGSMALAPLPLVAVFALEPGTPLFFGAVGLAGALANAGFPLLIVSAQDLAPDAEATASGMLMGLTVGAAGVLYAGIGQLQEVVGLTPAMGVSYLTLIPGAALAHAVLARHRSGPGPTSLRCS